MMSRVFKEIWNDARNCDRCREARREFRFTRKKRGKEAKVRCLEHERCKWRNKGIEKFSPPYPGFINTRFSDESKSLSGKCLFLVLESLGGGRPWLTRSKHKVEDVVSDLRNYYLEADLVSFHQFCIRNLLKPLQTRPYIVADTIKCYCTKTDENFNEALKHCSKFLERQLFAAKPAIVIPIGQWAARSLQSLANKESSERIGNVKKLEHGKIIQNVTLERKDGSAVNTTLIYCRFPSTRTADFWFKSGQERRILDSIKNVEETLG